MASSDAKPFPIKNTTYRVTFPILDADGDLVTGAAGLDSEVSLDGGTFADCTNEATEIATSSGMYYLDLSSDEMNADTVAIIVKTSTSGAKTTPIVLYPVESTDIPVNVKAISDDTTAADNAELDYDGTGYAKANSSVGSVSGAVGSVTGAVGSVTGNVGGNVVGSVDSVTGAVGSVTGNVGGSVASVTGAVGSVTGAVASVTGAVGSVTGNVGGSVASVTGAVGSVTGAVGSVTGAVGSVTGGVTVTTNNDKTGYGLSAAAVQAIWNALTSALTTAGSIGKKLADWVVGTIDTYTGNTKQTGDSYARLGAPAGASVSADVAAVKADTAAILIDTGTTLEADLDAILADTNELQTDWHNGGRLDLILDSAASAGDPWITALPGAYGAGTAGKIIGDNINAPIGAIDTVVDAIKAKTDNLPAAPADDTSIDTQLGAIQTDITAIKGYVDTEVAAVLAAVDTEVAAIKAKTDNLPADPASETNVNANETKIDAIDAVVDAVKVVTDKVTTALELDGAVYRLTANALEQAPSGGATVAQIADGVWDEAAADHVAAGSMGKKLNDVTGGSPVNIQHDSTVILTDS